MEELHTVPSEKFEHMGVSRNGGFPQQPWVLLLKMIILGCGVFLGTTIFGNIHILLMVQKSGGNAPVDIVNISCLSTGFLNIPGHTTFLPSTGEPA